MVAAAPSSLGTRFTASLLDELSTAGYGYGNAAAFESSRAAMYPALKGKHLLSRVALHAHPLALADTVYLDSAASPPSPPAAVQAFLSDISTTLYSNPHSRSTSSATTSAAIDVVRGRVLTELCGLSTEASKQWDVVFTAGTTAALKLVGDAFPWRRGPPARFRYLKQSHTRCACSFVKSEHR